VEREGVRRARLEVARADRLLWVADVREPLAETLAAARAAQGGSGEVTVVANKIDLAALTPQLRVEKGTSIVQISALTGAGIDLLVAHLKQVAGIVGESSGTFSARRRHLEALERTRSSVTRSRFPPSICATLKQLSPSSPASFRATTCSARSSRRFASANEWRREATPFTRFESGPSLSIRATYCFSASPGWHGT